MPENNENNNKKNNNFKIPNNRLALFGLLAVSLLLFAVFTFTSDTGASEIPYSLFLQYLEKGQIYEVEILDQREIKGIFKDRTEGGYASYFKTVIPYYDEGLMTLLNENNVKISGGSRPVSLLTILIQLLPWVFSIIIFIWIFRSLQGGGKNSFSFGRSRAQKYEPSKDKVMFADVAGQEEAKFELFEVVDFLKNPHKFTKIGAKIPKGVLLVGNPGTGKTLLAKAVAGEAGVPFFHMSGSDFVEMFVGVGASRVRDLFEQGKKNSPCILFIDEIDAVGRTRGAGYGGGHDEREQTLNQLLVEMDGFETKAGVIVIAATNRADVLDPALLRPGRFDRQVVVDMPDVKEREAILKIHSSKVTLAENVDLAIVARATPGTSGADIANIVNEAALFAARAERSVVNMIDFEEARDKIMMGVARKSRSMTEKERKMTAIHEAGHALLHYYLENTDPIHKVSIIPRGRALGVTFSLPEEDKYSHSKFWLQDKITVMYGGYAAEELVYNETSTGTQNDIEQATNLSRKMVCSWGMTDELGPVAYGAGDEPIFIGKEIAQHKDYAESTASQIDAQIRNILENCLARARTILKDHLDELNSLADDLLVRETLNDAQIRELLGFKPKGALPGEA